MTDTFRNYKIYKPDYTTYGGEVTLFDFEGHHTIKTMSEKITRAFAFDRQCGKNIKIRNNTINQQEEKNVKNN